MPVVATKMSTGSASSRSVAARSSASSTWLGSWTARAPTRRRAAPLEQRDLLVDLAGGGDPDPVAPRGARRASSGRLGPPLAGRTVTRRPACAADQHDAVLDHDVVHGHAVGLVVEAAAGAQVEGVLVHRARHERHAGAGADDAAGQHRGAGEGVVVAQRVDLVVVGAEDRDRLAVHQRRDAALDLEVVDGADPLPLRAHRRHPGRVGGADGDRGAEHDRPRRCRPA